MIERLLAGEAALARGDLDDADRLFRQIAAADPRNGIALVGMARIAARRGELGEARALAVRALEIDPDEAAAARLLAELGHPAAEPTRLAAEAPEPAVATEPEPVLKPGPVSVPAPARSPRRARAGWRALLDRLLRRG